MANQTDGQILIASFERAGNARAAIAEMRDAGRPADQIGVLAKRDDGDVELETLDDLGDSKTGAHATAGASVGALGGLTWGLGVLAGVLPGIGPVIAGGALAAVLASGAAGAGVGGVIGALNGYGARPDEAAFFEDELAAGRTVVLVVGKNLPDAVATLSRHQGRQWPGVEEHRAQSV